MTRIGSRFLLACASLPAACFVTSPTMVRATPYASNVTVSGTTVNFILNEPADSLTYSINGGAPVALNGTTIGAKTFNLGAATDTFSIKAQKNATVGWSIPTGNILPGEFSTVAGEPANGLGHPTAEGGLSIISDDANILTRFNSPRGVGVNRNPNSPNFGTVYIANSAAGTNAASGRTLGDGMYALRADGSDAFAYGDAAQNPSNVYDAAPAFLGTSASSPFRVTVAPSGFVYVADWTDANGQLFELNPTLSEARQMFAGFGGPNPLLPGTNHGSVAASFVTGSRATNDLVVYTIDEDLSSGHIAGGAPTNDRNSLWRYDIGDGAAPSTVVPVQTATGLIGFVAGGGVVVDFDFGADGKIYTSQFRAVLPSDVAGIFVRDSAGNPLWNSLDATRTLLNDPTANDIFRSVFAIAVSDDQKWLAAMINSSDVAVLPLVNGIPDIANRLLIDSAAPTGQNSGRDIAFDAAGNIHYVSSGQGRLRVLAPGGHTIAETSWNGTAFAFNVQNVVSEDADFDNIGGVNGHDFLIWQEHVGTTSGATNSIGDANGDGKVDAADLTIWKNQYPAAAAVAGAVPEPTGGALALAAAVALVAVRRRIA